MGRRTREKCSLLLWKAKDYWAAWAGRKMKEGKEQNRKKLFPAHVGTDQDSVPGIGKKNPFMTWNPLSDWSWGHLTSIVDELCSVFRTRSQFLRCHFLTFQISGNSFFPVFHSILPLYTKSEVIIDSYCDAGKTKYYKSWEIIIQTLCLKRDRKIHYTLIFLSLISC